ncbi:mechanosensitive ion channel domain-containing protein [Chitinasiproducens palmae]|uniref:Small-conductance mechanosensitive channel n=1 Tax=Chitinasiproducens palmae TaxID=1770053 RepID=A0A1H2PVY1_9BURK|nr:mechanosensitive ion channel domain-containing protein [Chitinasiproducens palmae]SDV51484.1 Small-conductance mechanosensitive channel [Chitinasiproducens palmae]
MRKFAQSLTVLCRRWLPAVALVGFAASAGAQSDPPARAATLSPAEAAHALSILEDPQARRRAVETLRLLARAGQTAAVDVPVYASSAAAAYPTAGSPDLAASSADASRVGRQATADGYAAGQAGTLTQGSGAPGASAQPQAAAATPSQAQSQPSIQSSPQTGAGAGASSAALAANQSVPQAALQPGQQPSQQQVPQQIPQQIPQQTLPQASQQAAQQAPQAAVPVQQGGQGTAGYVAGALGLPPAVGRLVAPAAPAAPATASSTAAPAADASAAAAEPASSALVTSNGLTAQLIRQANRWSDDAVRQIRRVGEAVVDLPRMMSWWRGVFDSPAKRQRALTALWQIGVLILGALLAEALLSWLLRKPRRLLRERASGAEARALAVQTRAADLEAQVAAHRAPTDQDSPVAAPPSRDPRLAAADEVGAESVHRDEADVPDASPGMVEAHPAVIRAAAERAASEMAGATSAVSPASDADDAGRNASAKPTADAPPAAEEDAQLTDAQARAIEEDRVARQRQALASHPAAREEAKEVSAATAAAAPSAVPERAAAAQAAADNGVATVDDANTARGRRHAVRHRSLLRVLPLGVAALVLELLPLLAFLGVATLASRWLTGGTGPIDAMADALINAYITLRVVIAVTRLLVSPDAPALRLVQISNDGARYVLRWMITLSAIAVFGRALAEVAQVFGVAASARIAWLKLVGLVFHAGLFVVVLQTRNAVAARIRGVGQGRLTGLRDWLARVWVYFAGLLVIAVWLVWALGVEDGLQKLLHFIGVTALVVVVARVIAILALGGLARLFQQQDAASQDGTPTRTAGEQRRADRYYPLVRGVVSAVITIGSVIALFEAWGVGAIGWLTHGVIGRHLASAALTIAVAAVVAVLVWETVNILVERRLQRWRDDGDLVRAARLRTLLPMFRTLLFIAIAMVVGLTALNEIGVNTTPLLAGASLIGVALSLGSQNLIKDFVTGIFLLMENAMQVGDWVTVAGVSGSVEYLSIRTVRLRAGDGSLHTVPFSSVTTVNNVNRGLGNAAVRVSVGFDEDIDRVSAELQAIATGMRADPKYQDAILNDLELWGVDAVTGATVTLAGQIRARDSGRWGVQREFNRRMHERFRALGIVIYNPDQRVVSGEHVTVAPNQGRTAPPHSAPHVAPANHTETQ